MRWSLGAGAAGGVQGLGFAAFRVGAVYGLRLGGWGFVLQTLTHWVVGCRHCRIQACSMCRIRVQQLGRTEDR